MSEINFDLSSNINNMNGENPQVLSSSSDPHNPFINLKDVIGQQPAGLRGGGVDGLDQRLMVAMVSPRNQRSNSTDFAETAHFLRACSLCKRRLVPSRDIYMYRYMCVCTYIYINLLNCLSQSYLVIYKSELGLIINIFKK